MAIDRAASACSGAAAAAGCEEAEVGLALGVARAVGLGGGGDEAAASGALEAGSWLHPASQGTARVGAAKPRPMIIRRDS
jgi:hypothetical protein